MFKIKKEKIKKTILLMILFTTTYEICGGISITKTMGIHLDTASAAINNSGNIKYQISKNGEIDSKELYAKVDALNNNIDEQLAIHDELTKQYEDIFKTPEEHSEDCLLEDCLVPDCLTNISTGYDYKYESNAAIAFDENGYQIYGGDAVRSIDGGREAFIEAIAPLAQSAQKQFGIPASTIIAQAGLETGWGDHIIGNNIFGIKDTKSYKGPTVLVNTTEYVDGVAYNTTDTFKGYKSIGEAVYDYAKNVIQENPHMYSGVITDNWIDSVYGLGAYATNPSYFDLVIQVINDFSLTRFNIK